MKSIVRDLLPYADLDIHTPSGLRLLVPDRGAWSSASEVFISRNYDHYFQLLEGVHHWVDLGCNQGFFSFGLLEHLIRRGELTPETRVFLGDANETCVARVRAAITRNHLQDHWRSEQVVIGPPDTTVRFEYHKDSVHSNIFGWGRASKAVKLPTTNLSKLLAQNEDVFDLIKIDIEGAEKFLFDHHVDFLKRFRYGICEWHAPVFPGTALADHLRRLDWKVIDFCSSGDRYDVSRGHSWESPFGVALWQNPTPAR
jgi:FkbM family methyltransferase